MNSNTRIQKSFHEIGLDFFLLHSELAKGKLHFYAKWKIIPLFAIQDTLFFNTSSDPISTTVFIFYNGWLRLILDYFLFLCKDLLKIRKIMRFKKMVKLSRIILKYKNHTFIIVLKWIADFWPDPASNSSLVAMNHFFATA